MTLMYFAILLLSFLEKGGGVNIRLNKLESISAKDALCIVRLKLGHSFWKRDQLF